MKICKSVCLFWMVVFFPVFLHAQSGFDCDFREYCRFNNYTARFENCEGYVESSFFELNESGTELIHYTNDMTSFYFVKSRFYDRHSGILELSVISDANNRYTYYIDEKRGEIRVFFEEDDYEGLIVRFNIVKKY